jgi:hypothetical protein
LDGLLILGVLGVHLVFDHGIPGLAAKMPHLPRSSEQGNLDAWKAYSGASGALPTLNRPKLDSLR